MLISVFFKNKYLNEIQFCYSCGFALNSDGSEQLSFDNCGVRDSYLVGFLMVSNLHISESRTS